MRSIKTQEQIENKSRLNNLFLKTAGSFAEHILTIETSSKVVTNAFGRTVKVSTTSSLSYLHGLAVSGIRCAALLKEEEVEESLATIGNMARQHVPITIVIEQGFMPKLPEIAQTGAIIFQAFNTQSLGDRVLHAQVVAEKTLLPVIVMAQFSTFEDNYKLLGKKELIEFFGDPDNFSDVKSPAQGIVFGNKRKRVPNWASLDSPLSIGVAKDAKSMAFETAAKLAYSKKNNQELIDETSEEFERKSGRTLPAFEVNQSKKVERVLVSTTPIDKTVFDEEVLRKRRIATFELNQLYPLVDLGIDKKKGFTIIESFSASQHGWYFKEWMLNQSAANGWYVDQVDETGWKAVLENMLLENGKKRFWVDIPFNVDTSAFPKHQILVQHVNRDYPKLNANTIAKTNGISKSNGFSSIPNSVKKYADKGPAFSRVSRFFDDTACFYNTGSSEMIADPYQEYPIMPVSSAAFLPLKRGWAPEFHPQECNDIESILKACPHGAMPTYLLTIDAILKAGIQEARANGNIISTLIPQLKIWAKKAAAIVVSKPKEISVMGDFLPEAFEETIKIAKADDEKKKNIRIEYEAVLPTIAEIPVAITDAYFLKAEKIKPATGELFTLAVDPNSCTGCGTCAELCSDGGVQMNVDIDAIEALNAKRFKQVSALPSTADARIKKLLADKNFDSFAALMLDKELYTAFVGGTKGDDFSAEKSVIRMLVALANKTLKENSSTLEKLLSKQMTALNNAVKKLLSDSLPVTHLDTLMDVIHENSDEKLSMDRIMKEWGQQESFKVIARETLESKLELIDGLKEWKWALKEGFSGTGRADYSIVLDDSLKTFAKYPWNNFTGPVLVAEKGATAQTALGAFEGQLRHAIDQIKMLRRTELEAVNKYDPTVHNFQIAGLTWDQLTEEERKMVPPVLVLANHEMLSEFGSSTLTQMLESGYPIKLIILDNLNPAPENAASIIAANTNAYNSLLANKSGYLSRVSLADSNQMYAELESVFGSLESAVVSVLCPNAFAHDINPQNWRQLSKLAVNTRGYNLFSFNPLLEGNSFGTKFNTDALANVDSDWIEVELEYGEEEDLKKIQYKPTWADWAFTLNSWKNEFKLRKDKANTIPVSDYLALDAEQQEKKIPVILRVNKENQLAYYEVGNNVVSTTEVVLRSFRLLREMAGLFTEFPEQLKDQVTQELSKDFDIEKKKLTAELAKEKAEWEKTHLADIKDQMKTRLMQLAQQEL